MECKGWEGSIQIWKQMMVIQIELCCGYL